MPVLANGSDIYNARFVDGSGNIIDVQYIYHKDGAGNVTRVWPATTTIPSGDASPDPEYPDYPIYSIYGVSFAFDFISNEKSVGTDTDHLNAYMDIIVGRYANNFPKYIRNQISAQLDRGSSLTLPNWWSIWTGSSASTDVSFVLHAMVGNSNGLPGSTTDSMVTQSGFTLAQLESTHTTWINNIKWNIFTKLNSTAPYTKIVLFDNEPENLGIGSGISGVSAYEKWVRDFPAGTGTGQRLSAEGKILAQKRLILCAKAEYEQMHAINQLTDPNGTEADASSVHLFGPTAAFPSLDSSDANQIMTLRDMFTQYNGVLIEYLDGITVHNHRVQTRIETYSNVAPATNVASLYNVWTAINLANALRVADGKTTKQIPLMVDEAGNLVSSAVGGWDVEASIFTDGSTTYRVDNVALRKYRSAGPILALCWFGVTLWIHFVNSYSNAVPYNMSYPNQTEIDPTDGLGMSTFGDFFDHNMIFDYRRYDINTYTPTFPTKTWQEYHLAYTWGVYINMATAPTSTYASGDPPYDPWNNVTFSDGLVTMTSLVSTSRNMVFRPIWIRKPYRTHRVSVEINFPTSNASAKAKLRVRGYDKLNGLVNSESEVIGNDAVATGSNFKTVSVDVTHVGHGLTNLPDIAYMLICLDHNGVGTVVFRNPTITVL